MPKQFKSEIINFKKEQSLRERELTLKAKNYVEALARHVASTDRTNMRHLLSEESTSNNTAMSDLLHRVLRTSVEKQLQKHKDLKSEILNQSATYTEYLVLCMKKELNEQSTHGQGKATLNNIQMIKADEFSEDELTLIANDLTTNKNLTF